MVPCLDPRCQLIQLLLSVSCWLLPSVAVLAGGLGTYVHSMLLSVVSAADAVTVTVPLCCWLLFEALSAEAAAI